MAYAYNPEMYHATNLRPLSFILSRQPHCHATVAARSMYPDVEHVDSATELQICISREVAELKNAANQLIKATTKI